MPQRNRSAILRTLAEEKKKNLDEIEINSIEEPVEHVLENQKEIEECVEQESVEELKIEKSKKKLPPKKKVSKTKEEIAWLSF